MEEGKRYSLNDKERLIVVSLFNQGLSYRQITEHVSKGKDAVTNYLKSMGLIRKTNKEKGQNLLVKTCKQCGCEYKTYKKSQKFCSKKCTNNNMIVWNKEKILTEIRNKSINRVISSCGLETLVTVARRMFGSWDNACLKAGVTSKNNSYVYCLTCGKELLKTNLSHIKYCSEECYHNADIKRWNINRDSRRKNVISGEKIDREEIFVRDNWQCKICGKKVNPNLKHPNPMSTSIDHIIPLSKGGNHVKQNVQLAHFKCNLLKGTKLMENYG